jgi:RNA 2',3'-cyclic 3'-phosphodiesterase
VKRKIFISISIPEKIRKKLVKTTEIWQNLPVKWVKEQNLHLTLSFLGFIGDDLIEEICFKVRSATAKAEVFDLEFTEIVLAPRKEDPRMIWLTGKVSEELRILQENVEKELKIFIASKKSFRPHITLGRIRNHKWNAQKEKPEIFAKFPLNLPINSVEIMASDFASDGPEYTIIESCPLK